MEAMDSTMRQLLNVSAEDYSDVAFDLNLRSVPFEPFWVFIAKLLANALINVGLHCFVLLLGAIANKCCPGENRRTNSFKNRLSFFIFVTLSVAQVVVAVATAVLAVRRVLAFDVTGWQRYQVLVCIIANSGLLGSALGHIAGIGISAINMAWKLEHMLGESAAVEMSRAGFDVSDQADDYLDRDMSGVERSVSKDTFEKVYAALERVRFSKMKMRGSIAFFFIAALPHLLTFFLTHFLPAVFVFFPLALLFIIVIVCSYANLYRCVSHCTERRRSDEGGAILAIFGITISVGLVSMWIAVLTNYQVLFYHGENWAQVFTLDYELRNTQRYFNATYFASYQTTLNYINIVL